MSGEESNSSKLLLLCASLIFLLYKCITHMACCRDSQHDSGAQTMNQVLHMFSLLFSTIRGSKWRSPLHKTFIRNGKFLSEKQKWHPPTCSTMQFSSANSAHCHQMGAAFRPVAEPRGQKEERQEVEGNTGYMETGHKQAGWTWRVLSTLERTKQFSLLTYIRQGLWPGKPLEWEG